MGIFQFAWNFWVYAIVLSICGIWISLMGLCQNEPIILALLSLPFLTVFAGWVAIKLIFGEIAAIFRWIGEIFS